MTLGVNGKYAFMMLGDRLIEGSSREEATGQGGGRTLHDEKVGVRESFKSATKSMHSKVALKQQMQLTSKGRFPNI